MGSTLRRRKRQSQGMVAEAVGELMVTDDVRCRAANGIDGILAVADAVR